MEQITIYLEFHPMALLSRSLEQVRLNFLKTKEAEARVAVLQRTNTKTNSGFSGFSSSFS
ncbi:hypothetical protein Hanom_Chr12g01124071 [Helianthus anomalus]